MSRHPTRRPAFPTRSPASAPAACLVAASLFFVALCAAALPAAAADEGLARTERITNAEEQIEFGVRMAKRGLWSEALFRFRQADSFDPNNPRILNNIAVSYEALGRFDQALEAYQQAIRADRTNKDLRKNYSRFVEFYRAFRPDEQKEASAEDAESAEKKTAASDREAGSNESGTL